jgi:ubiquinol-cytochrome c reductase cytochrome c1 subunit
MPQPWTSSTLIDTIADELGLQRHTSTASSTAEQAAASWQKNALPAGATVFAIGSTAWYFHLYGRNVDAMTPAEEG